LEILKTFATFGVVSDVAGAFSAGALPSAAAAGYKRRPRFPT
jgi:hypothetical protein